MELQWEVLGRLNTRKCQYSLKDMHRAIERAGATIVTVKRDNVWFPNLPILVISKPISIFDDPKEVRQNVTRYLKIAGGMHTPLKFLGLK